MGYIKNMDMFYVKSESFSDGIYDKHAYYIMWQSPYGVYCKLHTL